MVPVEPVSGLAHSSWLCADGGRNRRDRPADRLPVGWVDLVDHGRLDRDRAGGLARHAGKVVLAEGNPDRGATAQQKRQAPRPPRPARTIGASPTDRYMNATTNTFAASRSTTVREDRKKSLMSSDFTATADPISAFRCVAWRGGTVGAERPERDGAGDRRRRRPARRAHRAHEGLRRGRLRFLHQPGERQGPRARRPSAGRRSVSTGRASSGRCGCAGT